MCLQEFPSISLLIKNIYPQFKNNIIMNTITKVLVVVAFFLTGLLCGKLYYRGASKVPTPVPTYFNESGQSDSTGVAAGTVTGKIFEVKEGGSIQEAVGKAKPGDLIRIFPGIYHETVY